VPQWVVTWLPAGAGATICAIVEAGDEPEAARHGAILLDEELRGEPHHVEVESVAVAPLAGPLVWYGMAWTPDVQRERDELQCCGGANTPTGHSGFCPVHPFEVGRGDG
jgi:hypothetical protein